MAGIDLSEPQNSRRQNRPPRRSSDHGTDQRGSPLPGWNSFRVPKQPDCLSISSSTWMRRSNQARVLLICRVNRVCWSGGISSKRRMRALMVSCRRFFDIIQMPLVAIGHSFYNAINRPDSLPLAGFPKRQKHDRLSELGTGLPPATTNRHLYHH